MGGSNKVREVFEATYDAGTPDQETDETDTEDVFQVVANQMQAQDTHDEEDAIEVFESYQNIRRQMQQKKMARGYKQPASNPTWTLSGTLRGKIEQMKARSRCHVCNERGHWKRECPRRKSGSVQHSPVAKPIILARP